MIIVDQGWEFIAPFSRPRRDVLEAIARRREYPELGPLVTMRFDEGTQEWPPFLRRLRARVLRMGAKTARVGGVWFDKNLSTGVGSGCATTVYLYLRNYLPTVVDPALVGCESDMPAYEDREEDAG